MPACLVCMQQTGALAVQCGDGHAEHARDPRAAHAVDEHAGNSRKVDISEQTPDTDTKYLNIHL